MRSIDLIVIHCAATPNGKPFTTADIDGWHRERGFACIGYHKVIYIDGSVHDGRKIEQIGAHAEGYNAHSIGVCMIGTDQFTREQWDSLKTLVEALQDEYSIDRVAGHHDLPGVHKECPGFSVSAWKNRDRNPEGEHILEVAYGI
jgi:N-acetylmuramoyl-L-alanine amidase